MAELLMKENILVSIGCLAYNQEKYVAQAIESFLMQKTSFKFEILIHDDASEDNTAEIIKNYENKYPGLIKPIYQSQNQFSKGIRVEKYNRDRACGKYYALCEGDDYWTDPHKLQKQVDFMEQNQDFSICTHAASVIEATSERKVDEQRASSGNAAFDTEQIIKCGGNLFATNSMLFKRDTILDLPQFYYDAPVGDYPLIIYASLFGKVYYFDEIMSSYRMNVKGSWSDREFSSLEKRAKHFARIAKMLDEIDDYTEHHYNGAIEWTKKKNEFLMALDSGDFKKIRNETYSEYYAEFSKREKIILYIKHKSPKLLRMIVSVKRKISR